MKAIYNGEVIAESDDTIVVENNHYFPPDALKRQYFSPSTHTTHCNWKGDACYFHVTVNGKENPNAAWYYPAPFEAAKEIKDRVAFWHGVQITDTVSKDN